MFNPETYKGKRVFLTGHTGFKGAWLSIWLKELGAEVKGYALEPYTKPSLYNILDLENSVESKIGNILDRELLNKAVKDFQPDIIFILLHSL